MTTTQEINVEEIMKHIRKEVWKRKQQTLAHNNEPSSTPYKPDETNKQLNAYSDKPLPLCPVLPKFNFETDIELLPENETYTLNELLRYHDTDFINNAYAAILKRLPEHGGTEHYLTGLRNGRLTKAEILGRIRYSAEGRSKKVSIKGLLFPLLIHTSYKIPILGKIIRISTGLLNLPTNLKNFRVLENMFFIKNKICNEQIKAVQSQIQLLRNHIADTQDMISENLTQKASKADVNTLVNTVNSTEGDVKALVSTVNSTEAQLNELNFKVSVIEESLKPDPTTNLDAMYVEFENRFRGSREEIIKKQKIYLPYIEKLIQQTGSSEILDLGCGRGEWLELLKKQGYTAKGVDTNKVMVAQSRELGLDIVNTDVLDYLKTLPADSIAAVTGFHIIEHLPFNKLISLIDESFRVLKTRGMVILETPNPENLIVGACNFYLDPTHKRPIPPGTLYFLVKSRGFTQIKTLRIHPNKDFHQQSNDTTTAKALTSFFTKEQDYAIIAFKS